MNYRRLPIFLCLTLTAAACLVAVSSVRPTRADAVQNSWLDQTIETTKKKDLTGDEFNQRTNNRVECSMQTAEEWVPTPWWVWIPPKEWVSSQQCLHSGATGYFGEDNTSKLIVPFGSTRIERLTDTNGSYLRSTNELSQVIPNTNKLLFITSLYGQWHNPGPRNLRIVDNWNETFPVEPTPTGLGNVQRKMTQEYDYTLNDNGTVIDGIRSGELAASANGEWLHALVEQKASILLNTNTHEIIPFADIIYPTYSMKVDVSNDGRFVARSYDLHSFKIYDTTRCGADQGAFIPRNCQSIELLDGENSLLHALFPGKEIVIGRVKFVGNGNALDIDLRVSEGSSYQFLTYRFKPSGSEPVKYLAMGDSFSSGEGAFDYLEATDRFVSDEEYNVCHVSRKSYPYLLQKDLQADWFHSIACSGSESKDMVYVGDPGEYLEKYSRAKIKVPSDILDKQAYLETQAPYFVDNLRPGYVPQNTFVAKEHPNIVTMSMGGNDIAFADIIKSCIFHGININQTCFSSREEREGKANEIDQKISTWTQNFVDIKNSLGGSDPKLYVMGYPKIISTDLRMRCGLNVPFDDAERLLTDRLVDYLNTAVKVAADAAGVRYVDASDALYRTVDQRLCGGGSDFAVNGLDARSIINECASAKAPGLSACPNSFHPNQLGQKLIAETIASRTANLNQTMPQNSNSMADLINKRMDFVGDVGITLQNHRITYQKDIAPALIAKGEEIQINIPKASEDLPAKAGTTAIATAHSTPTNLGQLPIAADSTISGELILPANIETGYHRLIISYIDIADNTVEKYTYFYAAQSTDDWDGDGVSNSSDPCVSVPQSGIDQDEDGIDDACDGEYVKEAQVVAAEPETETGSGNSSQNSNFHIGNTSNTKTADKEALSLMQDTDMTDIFRSQAAIVPIPFTQQTDSAPVENDASLSLDKDSGQHAWLIISGGVILVMIVLTGFIQFIRSRS